MTRLGVTFVATLCFACDARMQLATRTSDLDEQLTIPSDHDLELEIDDALGKKHREDLDRALDAREPGEQLEHAQLSQLALDRQVFTLDDLFRVGDDLFAYQFRPEQGLGNGLAGHVGIEAGPGAAPNLRRVQQNAFGGPDAMSCGDCHAVGGDDGAGTLTQNTYFRGDGDRTLESDVRNAPAVLGLGPIQALATEMSSELASGRAAAIVMATTAGTSVTVPLTAKGLSFGSITALPDGTVDASHVTGVSPDLVVRPFGWKGHQPTLREMIKESFRVHLGIVSLVDQQAVRDGRVSSSLYGDGPWYDVDNDGANIEVEDGMLSTMVAYLSQLEIPIVQPPDDPSLLDRFARGRAVFDQVQCGTCHVRSLTLVDPIVVTHAEQTENTASPTVAIDVARAGMRPKIQAIDLIGSAYGVPLFSDLRRHEMGTELASPVEQIAGGAPIPKTQWLTRPLWGLADTAPYLHDGRAPTISDAVRAHGGEAQASRDAFVALPDDDRSALLVYLLSLARTHKLVAP
ncbi:MAG: hypothetical protein JWO36_3685 [Myxococcales bacterium]|nr:hypothetical protein [Myxococcales bacterium]